MDTYQRADMAIKSHTPDPPMKKIDSFVGGTAWLARLVATHFFLLAGGVSSALLEMAACLARAC